MITLCVLFNHPHEANIEFLRAIYSQRFDDIMFLHMGASSYQRDILQSYRGSYNFQGFPADALDRLVQKKSDLYVFVHDDVLLSPLLNKSNVRERLKLEDRNAFIPNYGPAHGFINSREYSGWNWIVGALWKLLNPTNTLSGSGMRNIAHDFARFAKTREQLGRHYNFEFQKLFYDPKYPLPQLYGLKDPDRDAQLARLIFEDLFDHSSDPPSLETPIPLFCGLADIFAVDGGIIEDVLHGFGIMAAANIFAEVAIPTVLLHVADHVVNNRDAGLRTDWSFSKQDHTLQQVTQAFSSDMLAYHPVKLSLEADFVREVCIHLDPHI